MRCRTNMQDKEYQDRNLRVVILSGVFYPEVSGGAFEQWKFAKLLAEKGHEVTVLTSTTENTNSNQTEAGIEIRRPVPIIVQTAGKNRLGDLFRKLVFVILILPSLLGLLYRKEFDVLYSASHMTHPPARIASFLFSLPVINYVAYTPTMRDNQRLLYPLLRFLETINMRLFMGEKVFCRTPKALQFIQETAKSDVGIIHGIVDREKIQGISQSKPEILNNIDHSNESVLIFAGRLVGIKRPIALLDLIEQLPEQYTLIIVGDGPKYTELVTEIQRRNLGDRVTLTGQVQHEKALSIIASADVFVLPSKTEAYPTVVFEALCLGVPVAATPVGVLPEIKHDHLHISDIMSLRDAVYKSESTNRQYPGKNALSRFSMERYTDTVEQEFYNQLL